MIDMVELESKDIVQDNIEKLKQLFPDIVKDGEIDFDTLRRVLGDEVSTDKESYKFEWSGKSNCYKTIQSPSLGTLKPLKEDSIDFYNSENIIIEGDNLEVLKLLQTSYSNKIKMIYIDPPYNTGKDFVYPDNYSTPLDNYFEQTGQIIDGETTQSTKSKEGRKHTRWLNMMFPRLILSRTLLTDDGAIFISINDNEVDNLKKICNDIFGEENFVGQLIWKSRQNIDNRNLTGLSSDHEYVMCYSKKDNFRVFNGSERKLEQFKNPDNDSRGVWVSKDMTGLLPEEERPNCHYELTNPKTGITYEKPRLGWRYDRKKMDLLIKEEKVLFPKNPDGRPRRKVFLEDIKNVKPGFSSIIGEKIYTRNGTKSISELFDKKVFDFPKPVELIKELINQGTNENDIVLDFFGGSGTTGQSVLELNKKDSKNRKFILVQLPEKTNNPEFPTICDITKERIRRVITGYGEK